MAKKAKGGRASARGPKKSEKPAGRTASTRKPRGSTNASTKPRERGGARKRTRPEEQTFPEIGDLKDPIAMRHAKAFADEMFNVEEAQDAADGEKQAIFQRMRAKGAEHFSGHGYEFHVLHGEDKFTVRKIKRGSKPAKETPVDDGGGDELERSETVGDREDLERDHLDPAEPGQDD